MLSVTRNRTIVPAFIRAEVIAPQFSEEHVIRALREADLNILDCSVASVGGVRHPSRNRRRIVG